MMRLHSRNRSTRRAGFTLLEILVVVLIVGLLLGTVGTNVFKALFSGQSKTAANQIEILHGTIDSFYAESFRYPDDLEELAEPGADGEPWIVRIPLDPWNNEYGYEIGSNGKPMITCYGADGEQGGDGKNADISTETLGIYGDN